RVVPEFELDDVGLARQCSDVIETIGDDDACPAAFDLVGETAVARRFEQNKCLLHHLGQSGAHRRVRLAYSAAEMRRYMQDPHSAATAANFRLVPPGASISGTATAFLNLSSSTTRWTSILSGRQWLSWPQLPQTPFCLRRPSRCCRRSAFIASEVQISFIDCARTSPMMSLRPQSRKQDETRPSAFTE